MKYIILLRGINVGGRKIKMDELRACFEKAGYTKVVSVLQTGNLILNSNKKLEKLHAEVEKLLEKTFKYPARVLVITPKQLQSVIEKYPFSEFGPEFHRYALFTVQENVETLMGVFDNNLNTSIEAILPGNGVIYWRVLKGHTLDSTFGKQSARAAAKYFMTNRNLNTLEKVLKKCERPSRIKHAKFPYWRLGKS